MSLKDKAAIVGIGETDFSSNSGRTELHLLIEATLAACEDAGIKPSEIDGMTKFAAGEVEANVLADALGLDNINFWATMPHGGNAGAGTVTLAAMAVATGLANNVLCWRSLNERSGRRFGQPTVGPTRMGGFFQFTAPYGLMTPAQFAALTARRHMYQYGTTVEQLAAFTINSRAMAANNPRARFYQRPLTLEEYYTGRMVSDPLRVYDCCLESDGAVALLITSAERAKDLRQTPAYITATAQGMGRRPGIMLTHLYRPDITVSEECSYAANDLWERAGVGPEDVDVMQLYDHFSPLALMALEDFGFCKKGEAGPFVESGGISITGKYPTNTAGGLVGEAYIHGMNLISEAVRQIRGTSPNQVKDVNYSFVATANGAPLNCLLLRK